MRYIFSLSLLFCAALASAQVVTDKLEAYFSFDNCKAIDDSGNGSSGALKGAIACTCGLRDSAMLFFDNNDAMVLVGPFADVFSTSDFTVGFYFRPTPQSADQNASQLVMAKQDSCNLKRSFWVRYNDKFRRISAGISENDTLFANVTADLDKDACWQYITITRSNTRFSIYINGVLKDSRTSSVRINLTNTTPLVVGDPVCPLDLPLKGVFDELRFHSKALSVDEISRYNLRADKIFNRDTLVYLGNSFQASVAQYCVGQYEWTPLTGISDPTAPQPLITPTETTTYKLTFTYADGCIASDKLEVTVIDPKTLDCNQIFIPNAFTPGSTQNLNDIFGISNPFAVDEFISFEIFDRWGGRVFSARDQFDAWDGNSNGKAANPGVFLYRLRYKCKGIENTLAGSLTLLR